MYTFLDLNTNVWETPEKIYEGGGLVLMGITIDSSGTVHILFGAINEKKTFYGFKNETGWKIEEIPWYLLSITDFQVNMSQEPVVLYQDQNYNEEVYSGEKYEYNTEIHLVEKDNGLWRKVKLPEGWMLPSFSIDNNNNIHLSFIVVSDGETVSSCGNIHTMHYYSTLKYSFFNGNNWTIETIYEE